MKSDWNIPFRLSKRCFILSFRSVQARLSSQCPVKCNRGAKL